MNTYKIKVGLKPDGKRWEAVISSPDGVFGSEQPNSRYKNWFAAEFAKNEKKVRKAAEEWCKDYEDIGRWGEARRLGVPESEVPMPQYTVEFMD